MSRSDSDESIVGEQLKAAFLLRPSFVVHAWHPPSSKAYFGPLVRIPKRVSGSRQRYHLDGVVQLDRFLLLVELKGRASALGGDVDKLAEIMGTYTAEELKRVLRSRVSDRESLDRVEELTAAFGYRISDDKPPEHGVVFWPNEKNEIQIKIGADICPQLRQALIAAF